VDDSRSDRRLVTLECPTCHNVIEVLPTSIAWCSRNNHKTVPMKEVKHEETKAEGR
jgi:hypothetical protein